MVTCCDARCAFVVRKWSRGHWRHSSLCLCLRRYSGSCCLLLYTLDRYALRRYPKRRASISTTVPLLTMRSRLNFYVLGYAATTGRDAIRLVCCVMGPRSNAQGTAPALHLQPFCRVMIVYRRIRKLVFVFDIKDMIERVYRCTTKLSIDQLWYNGNTACAELVHEACTSLLFVCCASVLPSGHPFDPRPGNDARKDDE
jgi:hypothetical protein